MHKAEIETFLSRTTLRQVEVMMALRTHSSMTKAAEELGISVAAVSRMTTRFETNLGIRLFAGSARRAVLLGEGREIIAQLEPLMQEIHRLNAKLEDVGTT